MTQPAPNAPQKSGQIVLICVIAAFVVAGILAIPPVRHAIFGGGSAGGIAMPGQVKTVKEDPRNISPMGGNTPFFGKPHGFALQDSPAVRRIQYYYLRPPAGAQPTYKYPMVVFLHDQAGNAPGAVQLIASKQMLTEFPAYVLVPMMPKMRTWAWPEKFSGQEYTITKRLQPLLNPNKWPKARQGMHDVLTLITQLAPAYNIDVDRIYVVGCGEGGTGVLGAISNPQSAQFFAGGVSINGVWSLNDAPKMAGVPLLLMQGLADKATDSQLPNSIVQIIHGVGGNQVYYQEFADLGDNCADPRLYTTAMWKWLFSLKKPPLAAPAAATEVEGYQDEMQKPGHP